MFRPTARLGPPVLLITATDAIRADPSNVTLDADFGPHCSKVRWDERRRLTVETDLDLTNATGLVLQRFDPETVNFRTDGGDEIRTTVFTSDTAWRLLSPIVNGTYLSLTRQGENVTFSGSTYGPGEGWTFVHSYRASTPGGPLWVTETIRFQNEGIVRPHIVPPAACA